MIDTYIDLIIKDDNLQIEDKLKAIDIAESIYIKMPSCKPLIGHPLYEIALCQKNHIVYEKTLSVIYNDK